MLKPLTVQPAPAIFERAYIVLAPNKAKGPDVYAPYLFDTKDEADEFLAGLLKARPKYWWEQDIA